jgi:threonine/homoserine/homoserine lactone efflux protein
VRYVNPSMLLLGVAVAAAFVALAEWRGGTTAVRIYGVGLVIAALGYVVFAGLSGGDDWLFTEIGGALIFAGMSVAGTRGPRVVLAVGWALHAGWDVGLHMVAGADFVPQWYVQGCVGFDLFVAGAIFVTTFGCARTAQDRSKGA